MQFLKIIDQHSIPIKLYYNNKTKFGSVLGGTMTIVFYLIALAYSIYIFYQWQAMNILPKIQFTTNSLEGYQLDISGTFLSLGLLAATEQTINPFVKTNNIITPILIKIEDNIPSLYPTFSESDIRPIVYFKNISLQTQIEDPTQIKISSDMQKTQYIIALAKCSKFLVQGVGTCASETEINHYFDNLPPLMDLGVYMKQYNPQTQKFDQIIRAQRIVLSNDQASYNQIQFHTQKLILNQGILFDQKEESTLISSYEFFSQTVKSQYFIKNFFGQSFLSTVSLRLDNFQTQQEWVYPKLGEVLAEIGSIISVLFVLKEIFYYINLKLLESDLINEIIKFKYPDYQNVTVKYNCFGQIKEARYKKQAEWNLCQFKSFHKEISQEIKSNLNIDILLKSLMQIQFIFATNQNQLNKFQKDIPLSYEHDIMQLGVEPQICTLRNMKDKIISNNSDQQNLQINM